MKSLNVRTRYKIIGGDFSAQEPRLTAFYAQDKAMIDAYAQGRDLYAVIGSMCFNKPYEDCLEFYPEGTKIIVDGKEIICGNKTNQNKEGKGRRSQAKSVLLGLLYGRGAKSVGEQIGKTTEEAQEILDKFFKAFPSVKNWIDQTHESAYRLGYVEDIAGRRRRLPDLLLEPFEIKSLSNTPSFNPLLGTVGTGPSRDTETNQIKNALNKARNYTEIRKLKEEAAKKGFDIKDNRGFISQAERQSVNARVQGGAATLTKRALIELFNNEELRDLGASLINTVHDEILIEAPAENSERCAELLCSIMKSSAKKYVSAPEMSVDAYIVDAWYEDEYAAAILAEYKNLQKTMSPEDALRNIIQNHTEQTADYLKEIIA